MSKHEEIIEGIRRIKAKAVDADVLVAELEKVKNELPASAKAALDKHQKKKSGKR